MNTQILKRRFKKVESDKVSVLFSELGMITSHFFNREQYLEDEDWFLIIDEIRRRGFSDDEIQQYLENLITFVVKGKTKH